MGGNTGKTGEIYSHKLFAMHIKRLKEGQEVLHYFVWLALVVLWKRNGSTQNRVTTMPCQHYYYYYWCVLSSFFFWFLKYFVLSHKSGNRTENKKKDFICREPLLLFWVYILYIFHSLQLSNIFISRIVAMINAISVVTL